MKGSGITSDVIWVHHFIEAGVRRVVNLSVSVRQEAIRVVMAMIVCAAASNAYAGFERKGLEEADESFGQVVAGAQKHYRVVALRQCGKGVIVWSCCQPGQRRRAPSRRISARWWCGDCCWLLAQQ